MSLITEFTVPTDAFALGRAFEADPGMTVEVERLATHSREWVMPFLWVTCDDLDAVADTFRDDPSVDELRVIDTDGDVGQFNVEWAEEVQDVVDQIVDQHGIMQEADAVDGTWFLKLKFVDQEALRGFQSYFRERDYEFELQRLYDASGPKEREYDLTPEQREVLVAALEGGYFSVPRDAQIEDLADEIGVSTNAVSQRLRRATRNLARNTLTVSPPANLPDGE